MASATYKDDLKNYDDVMNVNRNFYSNAPNMYQQCPSVVLEMNVHWIKSLSLELPHPNTEHVLR